MKMHGRRGAKRMAGGVRGRRDGAAGGDAGAGTEEPAGSGMPKRMAGGDVGAGRQRAAAGARRRGGAGRGVASHHPGAYGQRLRRGRPGRRRSGRARRVATNVRWVIWGDENVARSPRGDIWRFDWPLGPPSVPRVTCGDPPTLPRCATPRAALRHGRLPRCAAPRAAVRSRPPPTHRSRVALPSGSPSGIPGAGSRRARRRRR